MKKLTPQQAQNISKSLETFLVATCILFILFLALLLLALGEYLFALLFAAGAAVLFIAYRLDRSGKISTSQWHTYFKFALPVTLILSLCLDAPNLFLITLAGFCSLDIQWLNKRIAEASDTSADQSSVQRRIKFDTVVMFIAAAGLIVIAVSKYLS